MRALLAWLWLVLLAASVPGWGQVLRRVARATRGTVATTAGLGLAGLVAIGGLLNLGRIAHRSALVGLVLLGAGLWIRSMLPLRRPRPPAGRAARLELALTAGVVVGVVGLSAATLFPAWVFNFHDDLQKYFAHPALMLGTGTLSATPLSALGFETLGGQAFLHGLLLAVLPSAYLPALDGVLGLAVLLAVAATLGWGRVPGAPVAAAVPLLIALVNPQIVNVSATYVGAALMATAVGLTGDDREELPSPLLLGAVYAALAAVKSHFALFAILHLPAVAVLLGASGWGARRAAGWALRTTLAAGALLAPWLLLHLPLYLGPRDVLPPAPPGPADPVDLLSLKPLFYADTYAHYTGLMAAAALGAALAAAHLLSRGDAAARRRAAGALAGALAGIAAALILMLAAGPRLAGGEVGLRFAIPFLLGSALPSLALALGLPSPVPRPVATALPLVTVLGLGVAFGGTALARARQAVTYRTVLAFGGLVREPGYAAYCARTVFGAVGEHLRALQAKVPPGARLLAWVNHPSALDFARNGVIAVEPTALGTPWARLPSGIDYVLWQYRGYATRTPRYLAQTARGPGAHERRTALRIAQFTEALSQLVAGGQVIEDDGEYRLVRIR